MPAPGAAHDYVHVGGHYEWDSCAPVAAGLHVSRIDRSPLIYTCADLYLPDLLVCRKELSAELLRALN
jgi:3'(2'), 5'-bisphosphate nucleotidase